MSLVNLPFHSSHKPMTSNQVSHTKGAKEGTTPEKFIEHPDGRSLSLTKILSIMSRLECLTLPYCDSEGNSLQLWKIRPAQLLGTVHDKQGRITVVSADKIRVLSTKSSDPSLILRQLEQFPPKEWHLIFNQQTSELDLWPLLRAAGKDWFIEVEKSPYKDMTKEQVVQKLLNDGYVLIPRNNEKGSYVHPETGATARLDPRNQGKYGEPNHVDFEGPGIRKIRLYYKDPYGLHQFYWRKSNNGNNPSNPPKLTPAQKQFEQLIQLKKLTDTFNSTHRQNPISATGGSGSIGGVACGTEYIEGLFDGPEAIFEHDHLFCMPKLPDGSLPFSDLELRQILRELAIGIYVHDTIPFFSLHFNQNADLVPVIHPVYAKTLVGRVISMLDYIMKGYLNGGIYQEQFIDQWEKDPNWDGKSASALQQLIAFEQYCHDHLQGEDKRYFSLRDIHAGMKSMKNPNGEEESASKILQQFSGFSNSFRIISKLKSIQKEGNLFLIDSDFDVFYTINPSPGYKQALDTHLQGHGGNPLSYESMIAAYEVMREQIHDHMVKMPLCRPFFAMLSVINFFSGYFSTLKKHRKIPILPGFESLDVKGCPSIFPHLPIKKTYREMPKCNLQQAINKWIENKPLLVSQFVTFFRKGIVSDVPLSRNAIEPNWTSECVMPLQVAIYENIVASFSLPMQRIISERSHKRHQDIKKLSQELSLHIAGQIFESLSVQVETYMEQHQLKSIPWLLREIYIRQSKELELERIIHQFLRKIPNAFPNKSEPLFEEPIVCTGTRIRSQMSFDEVEEGKRIVGGCGMELKVQAVEASPKASQILQESWSKMISLAPESWKDLGNNQGAVFRLSFEDVPAAVSDNYEWMESLLFLRPGEKPEEIENRIKLEQAILNEDSEEFFSLIDQTKNLHPDRYGRTLLHFAAQVSDPAYMEFLLDRGLSYLSKDLHGYLPIHYAAMSGALKPLLRLLKADVSKTSLNAVSLNYSTPLMVAIQHHQYAAVKLLLACRASFKMTSEGYNPLHCALHQGNLPIINLLLGNSNISACLNEMAEEEGTPLMLACELDSADLVKKMIELGADPNVQRKDGLTALEIALKRQCVPVLEILLEYVIPTDQILETATKESSVQVYRHLAQKKNPFAYKNSFQDTLLHIAIRHGNIPIANLLIRRSKNISFLQKENVNGESAFSLACALGLWEVIKNLYEKNAIVDYEPLLQASYDPLLKKVFRKLNLSFEDLQRCLLKAAEAGNQRLIQNVLIPEGADIHALQGLNGWRITHYLAKSDGIDLFLPLIADSQDLLQPLVREGNKTLAYIAAENGSRRILRLLLEQMKSQHCTLENHYSDRHLFYAVIETGLLDQVQFMLDLHKDLPSLTNQILDQKKTTPAHLAAQIGSLEIIKALSEGGANLNAKDAQGFTPLDYAVRLQAKEIVTYLLKHKVKLDAQAFYWAALQNDLKILHLFTQQPNHQKLIDIALARALRDQQTQACLRLLQCGPSLEYATDRGWTPLLMACSTGQYAVICELLKHNPLDNRTVNQMNPLDLVCRYGHVHCISLLVEACYALTDSKAIHNKAVSVEFGESDDSFQENIKKFLTSLRYGNAQAMKSCLENFDPHEKIFIEHKGQKISGLPILLLLYIDRGKKFTAFITEFFKSTGVYKELKNNIKDTVNGNTYAHLLTMANLSFFPTKAEAVSKNHQGQTILHLAAQAPLKFLSRILDRTNHLDIDAVDNLGRTPLFYAIESNSEANLQLLIEKRANLNHYDHERITPLLFACQHQSVSMIRALLRAGANPDLIGTKDRIAPLFLAIKAESDAVALALIVHGAKCDIRTSNGIPLVHQLAVLGKLQLLRLFGAKGLLGVRDNNGLQAIHLAAAQGKSDSVMAIVASDPGTVGADLDMHFQEEEKKSIKGITPLHLAAGSSNLRTVQTLLDANANPDISSKKGQNILSSAANVPTLELFFPYSFSNNPKHLCKALLQVINNDELNKMIALYNRGVTINSNLVDGLSGLHLACQFGALQCTQWLLQNGADPSLVCMSGETAFELAAANSSYEQFCFLLEYTDFDVNQVNNRGETLMHIAAKKGNLHHIILLILHGADLEETDARDFTSLHYAALGGHHQIVQILLLCGTDVSVEGVLELVQDEKTAEVFHDFLNLVKTAKNDASALHLAVRSQNPLALRLLIHLQDIDQQDEEGTSALHLSVQIEQIACMKHLIQEGASVNLQDHLGKTALHYACEQNDLSVVEALIQAGADPEIKDHSGLSIRKQILKGGSHQKEELLHLLMSNQKSSPNMIAPSYLGHLWSVLSPFGKLLDYQGIADITSFISQNLFCVQQPQQRITNDKNQPQYPQSIKRLENERTIEIKNQILNDCQSLVEKLLELEDKQETSKMALQQLNQLYRVHRASCQKPLIVDGTDVGILLLRFKQQFPAFFEKRIAEIKTVKRPVGAFPKSSIMTKDQAPIISLENIFSHCTTFKDARSLTIRYLTALPEKNRLSIDLYIKILNGLESKQQLTAGGKMAFAQQLLYCTTNQGRPISIIQYSLADLKEYLEEACRLCETCGEGVTFTLRQAKEFRNVSLNDQIHLYQLITALSKDLSLVEIVQQQVEHFVSSNSCFTDLIDELENLIPEVQSEIPTEDEDLDILLDRFAGNDSQVKFPMSESEIKTMKENYLAVQSYCQAWKHHRLEKLVSKGYEIRQKEERRFEDLLKLIAIGRLAIRIKFPSIYMYKTQVLTVLGLLQGKKNCIAQVKTGEGKSKIATLLTFVLAMQKKRIHMISSSHELAMRDQLASQNFFKIFGVTTSHICSHHPEAECFQSQILFGTASDYQFAIMREMLNFQQIFPEDKESQKRFDCAVIDEVDNLTIDTALHGARLGSPAEVTYDWVYVPIFKFVQEFSKSENSLTSNITVQKLRAFLHDYLNGKFAGLSQQLSDQDLKKWLRSAHHALFELKEKKNYIIGEKEKSNGEMAKAIHIVDYENTGNPMPDSRWSDGVHEFVEVKHNIEVERESPTAISLSHSVFYPMYTQLYGLTGTLGSDSDREQIREIYGMDSFDVPTHKPQIREDMPCLIIQNDQLYFQVILDKIREIHQKSRPLLVLCPTIVASEMIGNLLTENGFSFEMLNGIQTKKESEIIGQAGLSRAITVATNTAGRGIDIQLSSESVELGGLHVLITFYPESERVEYQARGRAG